MKSDLRATEAKLKVIEKGWSKPDKEETMEKHLNILLIIELKRVRAELANY